MSISLGPPPIAAESSRTEKEEKVDAGSVLAERERFMARRAMRSGAAPSEHGIWRSCASDKRGGVEGAEEKLTNSKTQNVSFSDDPVYRRPVVSSGTKPKVPRNDDSGSSDRFPWVAVMAIVILVCVGALMAACTYRKRMRR